MKNLLILAFLVFSLRGFTAELSDFKEVVACEDVYQNSCDVLLCQGMRAATLGNKKKKEAYRFYFQSKRMTDLGLSEEALKAKTFAGEAIATSKMSFAKSLETFRSGLTKCEDYELQISNYIEIVNVNLKQAQIASERISEL